MISVVIPVGPNPVYLEWLPECIESVLNQSIVPGEIILIDDGANLRISDVFHLCKEPGNGSDYYYEGYYNQLFHSSRGNRPTENLNATFRATFGGGWYGWYTPEGKNIPEPNHTFKIKYHRNLCRVGVADSFNFGVALAENECVFMIGSDDKMMPTCLEECWESYLANDKKDAWYNVTIDRDSGAMTAFNNTAMVTKGLFKWYEQGHGYFGFPPSAFVAMDALALSILMKHAPDKMIQVKEGIPLVWLREHPTQVTHTETTKYAQVVDAIRNIETVKFEVPNDNS